MPISKAVSPSSISAIYNAAIHQDTWSDCLESMARDVGAASAMIIHTEATDEKIFAIKRVSNMWLNTPPAMLHEFETRYSHYESDAWQTMATLPANQLLCDIDFFGNPVQLRQRPDNQYLINQFGICHRFGARISDNVAWFDALTFQFPAALLEYPQHSQTVAAAFMPHVGKAMEFDRTLRLLQQRYNAALAALDHVKIGICVTDEQGRLIIENETASEIISENRGISKNSSGYLQCTSHQLEVQQAIANCSATAAGLGATAEVLLETSNQNTQASLLLECSPLKDATGELDKGLTGTLISIIDPARTEQIDTSRVEKLFSLSSSENSVLRMLIDGDSNRQIAEKRNVSIDTVKSQVSNVFVKTGTKKRSELIRLVAKITPPIG